MMLLSEVVNSFEAKLRLSHGHRLLPSHLRALSAMRVCRTQSSRQMLACCSDCEHHMMIPHSCGHRLCPHCQHFESQRWLENQQQRRVPAEYFLITFTVPRQLRLLAFGHQRVFYSTLMSCAWRTIKQFSENDKELRGRPGAIAVLHTHSRRLDYHPHVHLVVPSAAINTRLRHWRTRRQSGYLFSQKALQWVVDCQSVGRGDQAITYLGRYLYRGVIREKDIVSMTQETVTYRYIENTGKVRVRTLRGEDFLWLLIQHALPKGFRRARNYGFLHPNSKRLIQVVQVLLLRTGLIGPQPKQQRAPIICSNCGNHMTLVGLGLNMMSIRNETEPLNLRSAAVM